MKTRMSSLIKRTISFLMATVLVVSGISVAGSSEEAYAYTNDPEDPMIVVSLGDSYSSGEGIEPFYGQYASLEEKVTNEDWLAHRSMDSWPGLLQVPGIEGTMSEYKFDQDPEEANPYPMMYNCKWYFRASSGATTWDIKDGSQKITVRREGVYNHKKHDESLPKQIDIFDEIEDSVDYVTLTVGGNDVDFAGIIDTCARHSTHLKCNKLSKRMKTLWNNIDTVNSNIKDTYKKIQEKAPEADIIVADYPQLLDASGKGFLISEEEAEIVNTNATKFNSNIMTLVESCRNDGMKIHFVDVEETFKTHQAYSENAWINPIILEEQPEDLDDKAGHSAYSIHPTKEGAKAYASCVNKKIEEIELQKERYGYLTGKVCKASDRTTPIEGAEITVWSGIDLVASTQSDEDGSYHVTVPAGDVRVVIHAPGYLDYAAYTEILVKCETYMETFLMIEGDETETGTATGTILNALTGKGVKDVTLSVRHDWGNTSYGDPVTTLTTDDNGNYSVTLPLGNYTITAEKHGFITGHVNVVVQRGTTDSQNATITPIISGDNFRVVLSWGENPRDLDAHMEGTLSNGNNFHVYYMSQTAKAGTETECTLDVDDRYSYGPETITLDATSATPYYYYVHKYAGSGTLATSEAKVEVYQGEELIALFHVPTDQGNGNYWNVFAIVNGELIINNNVSDEENTHYANY